MGKNRQDLRVRQTHKMLFDAFIKLVSRHGFDKLTVRMIVDEAVVNRATFYRYFADKYDLAEKVFADISAEYAAQIQSAEIKTSLEIYQFMFEHVAKYSGFYQAIRSMPQVQDWLIQHTETLIKSVALQLGTKENELKIPIELVLRYLSSANIGIAQWWLDAGQPIPAEKMAQFLEELHLFGGIQALETTKFITEFLDSN